MSLLVGKKAPSFTATAVVDGQIVEKFSLDQYLGKNYLMII
jgi:peroxiredoxin (alkyl hydroperoxide reductase subunit C)